MVKLRLTRLGRKKRPYYRIVAVDSRRKRDGAYLEQIGYYNPLAAENEKTISVDHEKALKWLMEGAEPTDTVKSMLSREGIMLKYNLIKQVKRVENGTKEVYQRERKDGKLVLDENGNPKKVKVTVKKFVAVTDENGNLVRKYSDAEVETAYQNWMRLKEENSKKKKETKKLSKKAKAKLESANKAEA